MNDVYDVVVVGGGTAGVTAAIQAGLGGLRTLLVEKNGMCGGTMTAGGIAYPGLFYAWKKQVIAGIGWDIVTSAVEECGDQLPDFSTQEGMLRYSAYQIPLNAPILACLLDERLLAARVQILYHCMVSRVNVGDEGIRLELCNREGRDEITCRYAIDCTGDGSLSAMAGFEVAHPETCQPATLCCRLSGYDLDCVDAEALKQAADAAVAAGELSYLDLSWNASGFSLQLLRTHGNNSNHILAVQAPYTSASRSQLEIQGRQSILRAYRFLRRQPGFEHLRIDWLSPECGVRESAMVVGEKTITGPDYASGRRYEDGICHAFYPIDLHDVSERGVAPEFLAPGTVPQVPLGALIPRGSDRFLVAGRCLSSDRAANSALRVQATCMATGQAAGAAAVIASRQGTSVRAVPIQDVRELLQLHGAIVP